MTPTPSPTAAFFPTAVGGIRAWAQEHAVPFDEARRRFLQGATLRAVLADPGLADRLVLQGAAALRLFYGLPRRSKDLDFTIRIAHPGEAFEPRSAGLGARVKAAIQRGLRLRSRGIEAAPPGFPDSVSVDVFLKPDPLAAGVVTVHDRLAAGGAAALRVASVEQLLANKLHAVVSAAWRPHRNRSRDVWDVAWVTSNLGFTPAEVAQARMPST